ncbi:hydrolase glyoxylase [Lewinellaceae bacterium SD302]|nr:hydrolase glyoxylase [Lewinellaceae bacterium SD302]
MREIHQTDCLTVFQSALFQTTATLLVGQKYVLVVDPNWLPEEVNEIHAAAELAAGDNKQKFLLFTHSDYDHIIGAGRFEDYTTIASQAFVDNPEQEKQLEQIRTFDDEYYIQRSYPIEYPLINLVICEEGTLLQLGEDEYQFFHAPGHNADGLITYNRSRNILIAGDYLCAVEFPYLYDSLARYRNSLNKFEELIEVENPEVLIPGHGPVATERSDMQARLKSARSYLDELEISVVNNTPFDTEALFANYRFPRIMGKFHAGNVALVKRELT